MKIDKCTVPRSEQNSVCFSGHRFLTSSEIPLIRKRLESSIRQCWESGYRWFICGGALGFDTLAAEEVLAQRNKCPDIGLLIAVPCVDQASRWSASDRMIYRRILDNADDVIVLSPRYYSGCMQIRNQFMVQHSSVCICWLKSFSGGTGYTVRYAVNSRKKIINLCLPKSALSVRVKEPSWNYTFTFRSVHANADIVHLFRSPAVISRRWNNMSICSFGKRRSEKK